MPRLLAALACLALAASAASAQTKYSTAIALGLGTVPAQYSNRHASIAGSVTVFKRIGPLADLGLEIGYQRFASRPEHSTIGVCPVLPVGACVGDVTSASHEWGDLWYVGPTLRFHTGSRRPVRLLILAGLAQYQSNGRSEVAFRDSRGQILTEPGPFEYGSKFKGVGGNAGIGVEGTGLGRLSWSLVARVHGAIGGEGGEFGALKALSVTAGVSIPM